MPKPTYCTEDDGHCSACQKRTSWSLDCKENPFGGMKAAPWDTVFGHAVSAQEIVKVAGTDPETLAEWLEGAWKQMYSANRAHLPYWGMFLTWAEQIIKDAEPTL